MIFMLLCVVLDIYGSLLTFVNFFVVNKFHFLLCIILRC